MTAIDYSTNQVVTNSATGAVTNVNSAGVRSPGDAHVEYQGTFDAFQSLISLRDALRNKNSFIRAQAAAVASRLDAEEKNKLWSSASPAGTPDAP